MTSLASCRWCDQLVPQCTCADGPQTSGTTYDIACPYCGERLKDLHESDYRDRRVGDFVECSHCERSARIYHVDTITELTLERIP